MLLVYLALLGCRKGSTPQAQGPPSPPAVSRHYASGELHLALSLDRQHLTVADRLHLSLRAEAPESLGITLEPLPELPGLSVLSSSQSRPQLTSPGRLAVGFDLVLAPLTPGSFELPALTVTAAATGGAASPPFTVKSEPLTITVDSLLAKGDPGNTIADLAAPLLPPRSPWPLVALGLSLTLLVLLGLWWWRRRRLRQRRPAPPLPPHLLAYQALDRLLADDLLGRGQTQAFYQTLSTILRRYIEARFGLRAPERTTEEFLLELRDVQNGPMADPDSKRLLADFLTHCDLVKFARLTPLAQEAEEAHSLCRRFVRQTAPQEVPSPAAAGRP